MQPTEEQVVNKWISLKNSAASRKLKFDLTVLSVRNLLRAEKCFYTGVSFNSKMRGLGKTIDRIDPNKGYVRGNVVACTDGYNQAKAQWEKLDKKGVRAMIRQLKIIEERME